MTECFFTTQEPLGSHPGTTTNKEGRTEGGKKEKQKKERKKEREERKGGRETDLTDGLSSKARAIAQ